MPSLSNTPLGATVLDGAVAFRVWAPAADKVFLLTGAALAAAAHPGFTPPASAEMTALGDGTFGRLAPGLGEGERYRFWVVGTGTTGRKRDPHARELSLVPAYPSCDCIVRSPAAFPWHDAGFVAPDFRDLIVYELHVGVYFAVDAAGNDKRRGVARFLDLLDRVQHLRDLGVNAVELLPIQEFATPHSEGYNGVDLFSAEMDYHVSDPAELDRYLQKANALLSARGLAPLTRADLTPAPNQLKCVIDILHLNGIALFFDLVFNHAGGFDGNDECLYFLDRQPPGDNNRSLYFTDQGFVGGLVFAYWKDEVRQFLIDNAVACLREYHVDGIRYDEVSTIDRFGGGRFCQDLTSTTRFVKPSAIAIAEYWSDDRAAAIRPVPAGLGFDAAWGDKLREGIRSAIAQAAGGRDAFVDMDALAGSFEMPQGFDAGFRVVNHLENHDIVFAPKGVRIPALADGGDRRSWYARSRSRVALGLLLIAKGIPMLFMGQEILEDKPWSDDLDAGLFIFWEGLESGTVMQRYLDFCRAWVWMRRLQPAMRSEHQDVLVAGDLDRVLRVHRWDDQGGDLLFVANLQEENRFGYRVGFPGVGRWREIFNSDAYDDYPATGNGGGADAEDVPHQGMPASALLTLPANGFVLFAR